MCCTPDRRIGDAVGGIWLPRGNPRGIPFIPLAKSAEDASGGMSAWRWNRAGQRA